MYNIYIMPPNAGSLTPGSNYNTSQFAAEFNIKGMRNYPLPPSQQQFGFQKNVADYLYFYDQAIKILRDKEQGEEISPKRLQSTLSQLKYYKPRVSNTIHQGAKGGSRRQRSSRKASRRRSTRRRY
jgi:hypothetical protein